MIDLICLDTLSHSQDVTGETCLNLAGASSNLILHMALSVTILFSYILGDGTGFNQSRRVVAVKSQEAIFYQ